MALRETEETTELVLERMENSLNSLEQMSLDSINITDKLVMHINEIRDCTQKLSSCHTQEQEENCMQENCMLEAITKLLQELLNIAFEVNNVSHELEKETVYQRETLDNIKQIVGFLYAMSEDY